MKKKKGQRAHKFQREKDRRKKKFEKPEKDSGGKKSKPRRLPNTYKQKKPSTEGRR